MARNRMIKPEFWSSEQILNCSPLARLTFIGLWNFADDHGVHPASAMTLKAKVFPTDNIQIDAIKGLVRELLKEGLLREYAVEDKNYWIVTGWQAHQRIEKPRYCYPLPVSDLRPIAHVNEMQINQLVDENLARSHRIVVDKSIITPEPVDSENKIREKKINSISGVDTPPLSISSFSSDGCIQIFEYWQNVMNHSRAKLDSKRKRVIERALKLGFSTEDLKLAIVGCKNTPFNMGVNERKERYDDISLILRDAEHIERFMRNASKSENQSNCMKSDDIMAGVI